MKEIQLTKGKVAIVDDEDFELLSKTSWHFHNLGYARSGRPKRYMHRVIMNADKGKFVDHINGNKLDNRKCNLRFATVSQNRANSKISPTANKSGYKGVCWDTYTNKWRVSIKVDNKTRYQRYFINKTVAAKKYNELATYYFGQYARLNNI